MKNGLSYSVAEFFGAFKGWFFVVSLFLIGTAFVFDMIISLKSEEASKKRGWYFAVLTGLVLFESGVELFALKGEFLSEGLAFPLTLAGVGTLIFTPLFFVKPQKGENELSEEKRFLTDGDIFGKRKEKKSESEILTPTPTETRKTGAVREIDFSHVKSVVEKLNGYPLSPNDRKTVRELKYAVTMAENGDDGEIVREKINDGLGAILKIMSRYGV